VIDPGTTVYVVAVIFAATVIRTALGFGEALVAVPLLALRLPMRLATPLAVAVSVVVALLVVARDWRHVELRSAGWLTVASFLGTPVGIYVLAHANDDVAKTVLGAVIAGFGLYAARGMSSARLLSDDPRWLCGAGFVAGVMGGAYGMNGPPLAIYGTLRRWAPRQFRATLQAYFLIASLTGLVGYAGLGLIQPALWQYALLALPAAIAGVVVGRVVAKRMRPAQFATAVYGGICVVGVVLIAEGVIHASR
jgi:uncharacterized protein